MSQRAPRPSMRPSGLTLILTRGRVRVLPATTVTNFCWSSTFTNSALAVVAIAIAIAAPAIMRIVKPLGTFYRFEVSTGVGRDWITQRAQILYRFGGYLRSPSTSSMSYAPGRCSKAHSVALSAPLAKSARSVAMWRKTIRSPCPAKSTSCSPTMSPPRMLEKPIWPRVRAPVIPSRAASFTAVRSTPRPSAAASPSISAVPEGASTLWW
mmetsp:Transcript_28897/g.55103  ORF Transcript_28897/g.55103 Transcript_28897/m.55103 type:complete len:210 (-) Transcript_28897:488-1117(-)